MLTDTSTKGKIRHKVNFWILTDKSSLETTEKKGNSFSHIYNKWNIRFKYFKASVKYLKRYYPIHYTL